MTKRSEFLVDERPRKKSHPGPRPDPSTLMASHPSMVHLTSPGFSMVSTLPTSSSDLTMVSSSQPGASSAPTFFQNFIDHDLAHSTQQLSFYSFTSSPVDAFMSSSASSGATPAPTSTSTSTSTNSSVSFPNLTDVDPLNTFTTSAFQLTPPAPSTAASDLFLQGSLNFSLNGSFPYLSMSNTVPTSSSERSPMSSDEHGNLRTTLNDDVDSAFTPHFVTNTPVHANSPSPSPSPSSSSSSSSPSPFGFDAPVENSSSSNVHSVNMEQDSSALMEPTGDVSSDSPSTTSAKPNFVLMDDFSIESLIAECSSGSGSKRRSRASPEQLYILEKAFLVNKSPNAKLREELSKKLGMTERSIQIWFQNKRAKLKLQGRKSISEEGSLSNSHPNTPDALNPISFPMHPMLTQGSFDESTRLNVTDMEKLAMMSSFDAFTSTNPSSLSSLDIIGTYPLPLESLTIGSWRRLCYGPNPLVCTYSLVNRLFTWTISGQEHVFKMEIPFTAIRQLVFRLIETSGELHLVLNQPPSFWIQTGGVTGGNQGWMQCRDFTENKQAETVWTHTLRGRPIPLQTHLSTILQTDSNLAAISVMDNVPSTNIPTTPSTLTTTPNPNSTTTTVTTPPSLPSFKPNLISPNPVQKLKTRPRRSASAPLLPDFRVQQMTSLQLRKLSVHQHHPYHPHPFLPQDGLHPPLPPPPPTPPTTSSSSSSSSSSSPPPPLSSSSPSTTPPSIPTLIIPPSTTSLHMLPPSLHSLSSLTLTTPTSDPNLLLNTSTVHPSTSGLASFNSTPIALTPSDFSHLTTLVDPNALSLATLSASSTFASTPSPSMIYHPDMIQ